MYHCLTSPGPLEECWEESRGPSEGVAVVGEKFLRYPLKKKQKNPLILATHLTMLNQYGLLISTLKPGLTATAHAELQLESLIKTHLLCFYLSL